MNKKEDIMHEHEAARQQRMIYEKILYRYSTALECGDLDTIIAILREAESDPHLEQMLFETHKEGYELEESLMNQSNTTHIVVPFLDNAISTRRSQKQLSSPTRTPSSHLHRLGGFQNAAAVLIVAILVSSMFFLFMSHHKTNGGSPKPSQETTGANVGVTTQQGDIIVTASVIGNSQLSTGTITALNAQTGTPLWHFTFGKKVDLNDKVGLAIQDHIVYIAYNKQVLALQARNGKLLWKTVLGTAKPFDIGGDNLPQLIVDQHQIYASGYSGGSLYTLDTKTGKILWHYDAPVPALLTAHNGVAYVLANGDNNQNAVKALNGTDGTIRWTYNTTMPLSAVITNNILYVQSAHNIDFSAIGKDLHKEQKSLFALNITTGKRLWSIIAPANAPSQLVAAQGVLVLFDGNHFCGYYLANGSQVWCTTGPINEVNGEALVSVDGIVYGAYHPSLMGNDLLEALNPKNGSVIWSKDLGKSRIEETPITSLSDNLILPCFEGIRVFNRTNGDILWQSSGFLLSVTTGN
jgi:outer membrane protein assembly factor BamB